MGVALGRRMGVLGKMWLSNVPERQELVLHQKGKGQAYPNPVHTT